MSNACIEILHCAYSTRMCLDLRDGPHMLLMLPCATLGVSFRSVNGGFEGSKPTAPTHDCPPCAHRTVLIRMALLCFRYHTIARQRTTTL